MTQSRRTAPTRQTLTRPAAQTSVDDLSERKSSLVDDAYAAIRTAIRDASFAPGYQASEQEIALRLGMSRTPVHEAAIRLQEDGLVRVLPRKGILILALAPDDIHEIYDIIVALEGEAAAMIAAMPETRRTEAAGALDARTDTMASAQANGDLKAWGDADGAFHAALIEHARNRRMSRIIQTINDQSHRARMLTLNLRRGLETSIDDHRRIAQAMRPVRCKPRGSIVSARGMSSFHCCGATA